MLKADELSVADAAAILGRHRITIFYWLRTGVLKGRTYGRRRVPLLKAVLAQRARERRIAKLKAEGSST